ncbi:MAG: hypothetical protein MJK04_01320 [Psychrosphaera sp.]|nr:hypothetical protein [Psychrosphaera sp.]
MTLTKQTLSESVVLANDQYNPIFVRAYHREGLLVMGAMVEPGRFEGRYLWAKDPLQVNTFALTLCDSCTHLGSYLLNRNGELLFMLKSGRRGTDKQFNHIIKGYSFKTRQPVKLTFADLQFARTHGMSGGSTVSHDMLTGIFIKDNQATFGFKWHISMGWNYTGEPPNPLKTNTHMLNTELLRAFSSRQYYKTTGENPFIELKVHNKQADEWSTVIIDGQLSNLREFGPWIATEARMRHKTKEPKILLGDAGLLTAAGRAFMSDYQQTGAMTLINPIDNRRISIQTNEVDSEILLVERSTVFYRIKDTLYSAQINQNALTNTRIIITDKRLADVHWMM